MSDLRIEVTIEREEPVPSYDMILAYNDMRFAERKRDHDAYHEAAQRLSDAEIANGGGLGRLLR